MDISSKKSNSIDWNTEDELEIDDISSSSSHQEQIGDFVPSSSSCTGPSLKTMDQFLLMGFSKEMIVKAVNENGENEEAILDALLTYYALEESPVEEHVLDEAEQPSNLVNVSSDEEISDNEESTNQSVEKDWTVLLLVDMGYPAEEASTAIDIWGIDTPIAELLEFMDAAQFAYDSNALFGELSYEKEFRCHQRQKKLNGCDYMSKNKRKFHKDEVLKLKKQPKYLGKRPLDHDTEILHLPNPRPLDHDTEILCLPNPMIGFGVPTRPLPVIQRRIPDEAKGRPYFYFENVALAPKGVWSTMSRFLYYIDPEFVDSKFLCAAARKRGYIHNLPIHNRFQLLPIPPATIHEAFPHTREFWPSWDTRTQLNCLLTCIGSARLTDRIKKAVEQSGDEPSPGVKKFVIEQCKKWNLIWVGRNKVAPLEPREMEMLMGFPENHTRGGGITCTEQYRVLGNTFQVDTVAYHLSVLKNMFPDGINVLSLFSGIGGAEVALHRLGIPLKNVVSIEISDACRKILQSWWEETNQQGNLIHFPDVEMVTGHQLEQWMSKIGGFDLIIGGSPCNNIAGGNRTSRNGLEGTKSCLFFEYYRITELVRSIMRHGRH